MNWSNPTLPLPTDPQPIDDIQQAIVQEFNALPDWEARYEYIIKLGKTLPPMDEELKIEKNRVTGCQSQVWMHAERDAAGHVQYQVASDALIVKGLAALILRVYNHQQASTIVQTDPVFMEAIGMAEHLSMTRRNGLASMLKQMKLYATVFTLT
jgi:cysteine desulfuration protein SufE